MLKSAKNTDYFAYLLQLPPLNFLGAEGGLESWLARALTRFLLRVILVAHERILSRGGGGV